MKIFTFILLLLTNTSFGQTQRSIEEDLVTKFDKIIYWSANRQLTEKADPNDSLIYYNELFLEYLLKYSSDHPWTIAYKFKKLADKGLTITSSEDGLFRIYSWDTNTGGTMHIFNSIYQFKYLSNVYSINPVNNEGGPGCFYSNIYSLNANNKTYYLAVSHSILSTKDSYQAIKAFCIEGDLLNDTVHIIKTNTGIRNQLGFNFDFFSVVNRKERPVKLIYYTKENETIKIPVVTEKGVVTDKFITYRFTGKYFEKVK